MKLVAQHLRVVARKPSAELVACLLVLLAGVLLAAVLFVGALFARLAGLRFYGPKWLLVAFW